MSPLFKDGDIPIISWSFDPKEVTVGDIILLRPQTSKDFYVHRVVQTKNHTLFTKGDRAVQIDQKKVVLSGLVVGRRRDRKKIIWGPEGQYFKKVYAWLSFKNVRYSSHPLERFKRLTFLALLRAVYYLDSFSYFLKRQVL